jgi:hypothetical protein
MFGSSKQLIESARTAISGQIFTTAPPTADLASRVDVAKEVSACSYEAGTCWGQEVFAALSFTAFCRFCYREVSWVFVLPVLLQCLTI